DFFMANSLLQGQCRRFSPVLACPIFRGEVSAEDLSDRQLETDLTIEKIATAFAPDAHYTESEISKICQLFTTDYARLRRYLVDRGVLQRQNNVYRRVLSP
ncbi:DUF2087 domain-containing protein, partial [Ralstonia pseudosolanacearum]|uniref:DUF2087 domain-containing protein n=1 Tax=Ralstonia pseudosolanacearum TaxID=1310165 RepID=UPI001FFB4DC3